MGYEMYRLLTSKRVLSSSRPRRSKKVEVIDIEEEERTKELLHGEDGFFKRVVPKGVTTRLV